jgi:hypothetical protein
MEEMMETKERNALLREIGKLHVERVRHLLKAAEIDRRVSEAARVLGVDLLLGVDLSQSERTEA